MATYISETGNVSTNRDVTMIAAASGEAWFVSLTIAMQNSTATTVGRTRLERVTGASTGLSIDKANTRSRAASSTAANNASSQVGNNLIHAGGLFGAESSRWRPPRPYAAPHIINSEQLAWANQVNAGNPSENWFVWFNEDPPSCRDKTSGRRHRRRGVWSHRTEQTNAWLGFSSGGAAQRHIEEKWCANIKENPDRGHSTPHCIIDPNASQTSSDAATLIDSAGIASTISSLDSITLKDNPGQVPFFIDKNSNQDSTNSSSTTANLPTYVSGDLVIVILDLQSNSGTGTSASATGWTQLVASATNQYSLVVMYRIMNGTEGTSVNFTLSQSCSTKGLGAASYRGVDPINPIDLSNSGTGNGVIISSHNATSPISTNDNELAVLLNNDQVGGFTITSSPTGVTNRYFAQEGGFTYSDSDISLITASSSVTFTITYTTSQVVDFQWCIALLNPINKTSKATIGLNSSDSATLTSTESTASLTPTSKSDSDNAVVTDNIFTQPRGDFDLAGLTDLGSVSSFTPTSISGSDSATLTDAGSVTVPSTPSSSDSVTFTDSGAVVDVTSIQVQLQDNDVTAILTESDSLLALVNVSDGATLDDSATPTVVVTPRVISIRSTC